MRIDSHEQIQVDEILRDICREIVAQGKNETQWTEVESDDMFQAGPYVGGFSKIDQEFWFSYHSPEGKEWWFGFPLRDAKRIAGGQLQFLDLFEPT